MRIRKFDMIDDRTIDIPDEEVFKIIRIEYYPEQVFNKDELIDWVEKNVEPADIFSKFEMIKDIDDSILIEEIEDRYITECFSDQYIISECENRLCLYSIEELNRFKENLEKILLHREKHKKRMKEAKWPEKLYLEKSEKE